MAIFDKIVPENFKQEIKETYHIYEYYRNSLLGRPFSQVEIETQTICNRKCKICPNSIYSKGNHRMDLGLYRLVLEQLAEINYDGRIVLNLHNEPLLDFRLPSLIEEAKLKVPKSTVIIYTNGSLLKNKLEAIVEAGIDGIVVSQYEKGLQKEIEEFIKELPKEKKQIIRYRVLKDKQKLSTWGGLVKVKNPQVKKYCFQASTDLIIDWKGNVLLCCNDYFSEYSFGNLKKESILDIWNKEEYKEIKKELRKGNFILEICKFCAGRNQGKLRKPIL